jgi:gamma-glutamyltranspeptidase/glutathione hydrolase
LPDQTRLALEERGYRVEPHDWEFGDVQVIWRDGDTLRPAADPRDRGVGEVFAAAIEK